MRGWRVDTYRVIVIINDAACTLHGKMHTIFFTCPNYAEIRLTMMKNLNWVQTLDLNLLTSLLPLIQLIHIV
jgi:plasmid rolling circle replication initiator protein Rep